MEIFRTILELVLQLVGKQIEKNNDNDSQEEIETQNVVNLFTEKAQALQEEKVEEPIEEEIPLLTVEDVITASGTYPERLDSPDLTPDVRKNIQRLLSKVLPFLRELGVSEVKLSSGFRPASSNSSAGGAKKSLHMSGFAIDIIDDDDQTLAKKIREQAEQLGSDDLLHKYGLWMEHEDHTKGKYTNWVHVDIGTRREREVRIFIP